MTSQSELPIGEQHYFAGAKRWAAFTVTTHRCVGLAGEMGTEMSALSMECDDLR
jgi:hypothetical protein